MRRYPSHLTESRAVVNLLPGELFCEREPQLVATILGSCVSVCLWDQHLRFGGMNHHVLPIAPVNSAASLRYGTVAVPALVARMIELGSRLEDLQAKVFGGACVLRTGTGEYSVGQRNVEVAVAELYRQHIPLVACRLSGTEGVVLVCCTECGDVWVRPIRTTATKAGPSPQIQDIPELSDRFTVALATSRVATSRVGNTVAVRSPPPTTPKHHCPTCRAAPKSDPHP